MAGRRKEQAQPNDASLTRDYWLRSTGSGEPTVRLKILQLAIEELASDGPLSFNAVHVCDRLAVSPSLVNHYFGGRDALAAEATAVAYQRYVRELHAAAVAAGDDAASCLEAWMRAQIAWASANPGIAAVLNYNAAFPSLASHLQRDFQAELDLYFEFNVAMIIAMIRALRAHEPVRLPVSIAQFRREDFVNSEADMLLATSFALSALGAAVWAGGQHSPSRRIAEATHLQEALISEHVRRSIASVAL